MIKFENTEVFNFEGALRGMRNPLNSWDKSDSDLGCRERYYGGKLGLDKTDRFCKDCGATYNSNNVCNGSRGFILGPNDLNLAQRLIKAGSDHRKFLRQIFVSVDITAPLYWWKEFDTYKVATVANSCSTMHTIHKKEFTPEDFSIEHLINEPLIESEPGKVLQYNLQVYDLLRIIISVLNISREMYLKTKDKKYWWQIIQLLPTSYNQKRTVTLNYETLRNIYGSRRNHKLDEWSIGFMDWIDSLPYSEELIKY